MPVYRIQIKGEPLVLSLEGQDTLCGFVKNEYVWATDSSVAQAKASKRLKSRIAQMRGSAPGQVTEPSLKVEDVEEGFSLLKLLSAEGFVFYRIGT